MYNASGTHCLDIGDAAIAFRTNGVRGGIPLVLLPRQRATMDDWDPRFIDALAMDHFVVRFDSPGIGLSSGSTPFTIKDMARDVADFLECSELGTVDLLGWSMGGAVAQQMALDYPQTVRRMIVAGSSPGRILEGPRQHPYVARLMAKPEQDEEEVLFLLYPDTYEAQSCGRSSLSRIYARGNEISRVGALSYIAQVKAMAEWPGILHRARELHLPILVTAGALDIVTPAYRSFVLAQQVPDAKLIVYPASGHAFLFQKLGEFVDDVTRFLTE